MTKPYQLTMGVYRYQALDTVQSDVAQSTVRGTITADSMQQARRELRERGFVVRRIREYSPSTKRFTLPSIASARQQWEQSIDELAMLLKAGVPLMEALGTIAGQARGEYRATLEAIRDQVAGGKSLAEVLRGHPRIVDLVSVQLVEVGEHTGKLDEILGELALFKQRSSQLKDQVITILIYPVFLVILGTAAALFLMTYVMPPLLESLQETMERLPWPTRVVQSFSEFVVQYGWLIAISVLIVVMVGVLLLRIPRVRLRFDTLWLRVPVIGRLSLKQHLSRVAMVVAVLARSGIPLVRCLELAAQTCHNLCIRNAIARCAEAVESGKSVPQAMQDSRIFPPVVYRIFTVGEESGQLEELLDKLSNDYTRQVGQQSARITALLEPILIIVLAGLIGFLMLAIILPILEAGNVV